MPRTVPAIAGRIGTTDYWVTTMKVKELCDELIIPKDMPGWDNLSLEERYQRKIDDRRVKRDIAPYFALDKDRFTGSLIVAMQNHEGVVFEPVVDILKGKIPALYAKSAGGLGLLTLSGGEVLVPLDGQHRTQALKYAISGRDDRGRDIDGIEGDTSLANEDIVVMLVRYDNKTSRRIFNKVNRYARPTTKGQNLITDDDDVVAVILREDIVGGIIDSRLVRIGAASLSAGAHEFTTLSTLYDASKAILEAKGHSLGKKHQNDPLKRHLYRTELIAAWTALFEGLDVFLSGTDNFNESGDSHRKELRQTSILAKPIGQLAASQAAVVLAHGVRIGDAQPTLAHVIKRMNALPWGVDEPRWQGVLLSGKKMRAGKVAARLATDLIVYSVAGDESGLSPHDLAERICSNLSEEDARHFSLPEPIGLT